MHVKTFLNKHLNSQLPIDKNKSKNLQHAICNQNFNNGINCCREIIKTGLCVIFKCCKN